MIDCPAACWCDGRPASSSGCRMGSSRLGWLWIYGYMGIEVTREPARGVYGIKALAAARCT